MSSNSIHLLDDWSFSNAVSLTTFSASAAFLVIISTLVYSSFFGKRNDGIEELRGPSLLAAWAFFNTRFDFMRTNFQKTTKNFFKFKILHHTVIAVRGEEARRVFFTNRSLSFPDGYNILLGAAPDVNDVVHDIEQRDITWFNKQLSILINKRRMAEVTPTLFNDLETQIETWKTGMPIDPFKDVYNLIFQMTLRIVSCNELATDFEAIAQLHKHYTDLEESATPTALLLPWFPSPARKKKKIAMMALFATIQRYIDMRRASKIPSPDAIDVWLAQGLEDKDIISLVLGIVFAGVTNTGINTCWALVYMAFNPEWKAKVKAEVEATLFKYADKSSGGPIYDSQLSSIPLSAWEDEMPILDSIIRETVRLVFNNTAIRRNMVEDITIEDKIILRGDFIVYSVYDVQMNPDIYTNPTLFDPDRYSVGREEDKKVPLSFLGWGVGRHPCTGMKLAKLQIKMVIALFVTGYDYEIIDASGDFPQSLPKPNLNDIHGARPVGNPCYIRLKEVVA